MSRRPWPDNAQPSAEQLVEWCRTGMTADVVPHVQAMLDDANAHRDEKIRGFLHGPRIVLDLTPHEVRRALEALRGAKWFVAGHVADKLQAAAPDHMASIAETDAVTGVRSPYCGRLDPHPPHTWLGRNTEPSTPSIPRDCPGRPVIEGGNPAATRWPR